MRFGSWLWPFGYSQSFFNRRLIATRSPLASPVEAELPHPAEVVLARRSRPSASRFAPGRCRPRRRPGTAGRTAGGPSTPPGRYPSSRSASPPFLLGYLLLGYLLLGHLLLGHRAGAQHGRLRWRYRGRAETVAARGLRLALTATRYRRVAWLGGIFFVMVFDTRSFIRTDRGTCLQDQFPRTRGGTRSPARCHPGRSGWTTRPTWPCGLRTKIPATWTRTPTTRRRRMWMRRSWPPRRRRSSLIRNGPRR